jgi:hypothetical protein
VAAELALEELGRDRATVDLDPWALTAAAPVVDRADDELLARARFTPDQDGGLRPGDELDLLEHLLESWRTTQDLARFERLRHLFAQVVVLGLEAVLDTLDLAPCSSVRNRHGRVVRERAQPAEVLG